MNPADRRSDPPSSDQFGRLPLLLNLCGSGGESTRCQCYELLAEWAVGSAASRIICCPANIGVMENTSETSVPFPPTGLGDEPGGGAVVVSEGVN